MTIGKAKRQELEELASKKGLRIWGYKYLSRYLYFIKIGKNEILNDGKCLEESELRIFIEEYQGDVYETR
ncbi:MAG: hypothetical protein GY702_15845 [Desulfobulbaceae bacterium]|nr:hypothetical protein [Desulfobulbaceae bacterium]